ncbi:MAG: aminotransferase class V-fold PLP-dependent enzyme [Rhodospirillales bacterium]|nr:aminotransferase class V-fold PLP-dependent enzyme [Rhodospirillales bacterium]
MNQTPHRAIYLDYQASTPMDERVVQAMAPYFTKKFGNPHSTGHMYGWEAEEAVDHAREQVAGLIGAEPEDIYFTSGATESNNLAIKGVARFYESRKNHLITLATEHMCVLDSALDLESEGFDVTYLPVDSSGLMDLNQLRRAVTPQTLLVSVMAAHNEIGTLQPIAEIGAICRENKVFFHTDAAQAAGKIPLDVDEMQIDLMSISAHKMYGPMGVGALYVRRRPRVRLKPLFSGGGQEGDLRSGTVPTPLCAGLGKAAEISGAEMEAEAGRLRKLRDHLAEKLAQGIPHSHINGCMDKRLPGNLNLAIPGIDAQRLIAALPDLALSWGSACSSAESTSSHVLAAIGLDEAASHSSLRIGLGRMTTEEEVETAARRMCEEVTRLGAEFEALGANRARVAG